MSSPHARSTSARRLPTSNNTKFFWPCTFVLHIKLTRSMAWRRRKKHAPQLRKKKHAQQGHSQLSNQGTQLNSQLTSSLSLARSLARLTGGGATSSNTAASIGGRSALECLFAIRDRYAARQLATAHLHLAGRSSVAIQHSRDATPPFHSAGDDLIACSRCLPEYSLVEP